MTKEADEFNRLLKEGRSYIEEGNFDKAVMLYSKIRKKFESLPKIRKKDFIRDVNIFYEELSLYLKLNEAYVLADKGDLRRLKEILEYIYNLEVDLSEIKSASQLLKSAEGARKNYLEFYKFSDINKKFEEVYNLIEKLIKERKWNSVFREYAHLLMLYNKYVKINPAKKDELYEKLNKLIRDINVYKSMHDGYNNVKEGVKVRRVKEHKDKKVNKIREKRIKTVSEKSLFRDIRKKIEEGNVEEASMLIEG